MTRVTYNKKIFLKKYKIFNIYLFILKKKNFRRCSSHPLSIMRWFGPAPMAKWSH